MPQDLPRTFHLEVSFFSPTTAYHLYAALPATLPPVSVALHHHLAPLVLTQHVGQTIPHPSHAWLWLDMQEDGSSRPARTPSTAVHRPPRDEPGYRACRHRFRLSRRLPSRRLFMNLNFSCRSYLPRDYHLPVLLYLLPRVRGTAATAPGSLIAPLSLGRLGGTLPRHRAATGVRRAGWRRGLV